MVFFPLFLPILMAINYALYRLILLIGSRSFLILLFLGFVVGTKVAKVAELIEACISLYIPSVEFVRLRIRSPAMPGL